MEKRSMINFIFNKVGRAKWVKCFLLFYLFTFLPLTSAAQIGDHRDEFAVGVSGGYVFSTIDFMPVVPQKQYGGMLGGLTFRYTTEKYFSSICAIVAEVNYAQIGWQQDILDMNDEPVINPQTELPEEYERRINYVQVPLLARMGWGRERKGFQFFIQAGPQFGFYLNESTKAVPRASSTRKPCPWKKSSTTALRQVAASSTPFPKPATFCLKGVTTSDWVTFTAVASATILPAPTMATLS